MSQLINKKASLSLELILSISLLGLVFASFSGGLFYSTQSTADSASQTKAVLLSEEGLEAVKSIKNRDFLSLEDGIFGLTKANNLWEFSGSNQSIENFSREIIVSTIDESTKKVVSRVKWSQYGREKSVELNRIFSNWNTITAAVPTWANPVETFSINLQSGITPVDFVIENNIAYILKTSGNPGLQIFDVSNKSNITYLGGLNISSTQYSIDKKGDHLYITSANNNSEVLIVNVSNPSSPILVTTFNAQANADAISGTIYGDYFIFGRRSSSADEINFLNISNPRSPTLAHSINFNGDVNTLTTIGNTLFIGTNSNNSEIVSYNIQSIMSPVALVTRDLNGNDDVVHINKFNDQLIVGRANGEVYTFDSGLNQKSKLTLGGSVLSTSVDFINNYIFVAVSSGTDEFVVLDYSTGQLVKISNLAVNGLAQGVIFDQSKNICFVITSDASKELLVIEPN